MAAICIKWWKDLVKLEEAGGLRWFNSEVIRKLEMKIQLGF